MHQYLLSILIFLPAMVGLSLLVIPSARENMFRWISLAVSVTQFIVLFLIFNLFQPDQGGFQLTEKVSWISLDLGNWGSLQADYFVAIDGLSFSLIALSVVVMLIATISSWTITKNIKGYFILLLILNSAIIGSFCALDLLLFYVFFEFMLLPMYFLIGIWGGPKREYASIKFFLYTLVGSILILVAIVILYLSYGESGNTQLHTFNSINMSNQSNLIPGSILATREQFGTFTFRQWTFIFLVLGFLIKLPAVPFHTWLPDAHVEAPTPVSVILAALLLKIGGYGILRFAVPIFPDCTYYFSSALGWLGAIAIVYGALAALASKDLKRLIAYSSVSHMGFVLLGIASTTVEGIAGASYQLISHGVLSSMLFILAGVLYDRTSDRMISHYSGLSSPMPVYTSFILLAFFASLGLPGFSGFIAEVMVLFGAFGSPLLPKALLAMALLGLILGASYFLWTIQRMFYGPYSVKVPLDVLADLSWREKAMLLPLAMITLLLGLFPQVLLNYLNSFALQLISHISPFLPQ